MWQNIMDIHILILLIKLLNKFLYAYLMLLYIMNVAVLLIS